MSKAIADGEAVAKKLEAKAEEAIAKARADGAASASVAARENELARDPSTFLLVEPYLHPQRKHGVIKHRGGIEMLDATLQVGMSGPEWLITCVPRARVSVPTESSEAPRTDAAIRAVADRAVVAFREQFGGLPKRSRVRIAELPADNGEDERVAEEEAIRVAESKGRGRK